MCCLLSFEEVKKRSRGWDDLSHALDLDDFGRYIAVGMILGMQWIGMISVTHWIGMISITYWIGMILGMQWIGMISITYWIGMISSCIGLG